MKMPVAEVAKKNFNDPGEDILRQLKAKYPPKKASKDPKKTKKMKKKTKKTSKIIVAQDDKGLESCGSTSSPSSLTLTSSRDSGHATDSRDSEDNSDDINLKNKKPQKLSSRVAFFEDAIKTAANTTVNRKDDKKAPSRRQKEAEFLRAVESTPVKMDSYTSLERQTSEYSTSASSFSSDDFDEAGDPTKEEPKYGTLYLSERDLKMEKKLIKQVASEIEENGLWGVKKIIRKKINKWKSEKINIGVMGDSLSGKSSVINALGGLTAAPNRLTGRRTSCHQPTECKSNLNEALSLWELPAISKSGKYSTKNYSEAVQADQFDFLFVCTPTWFKSHQIAVAQELVDRCNVKVIFIRTKLDDSIINDRKTKPNSHDEDAVTNKVRNHCWESLGKYSHGDINLFLISTLHLNRYDGPKFLSCLINEVDRKERKKFSMQEAMTMALPAVSLELIARKREVLLERIWKIAAISTVSGIMPIGGYNLTADIEILQRELKLYRNQLGVTDEVLEQSSNCPNLVPVWKLLCEGTGMLSLLRQSALDQQWEEFSKFMNRLPLIGGNVSFAASCSVLKYCLSELCAVSIRYNELEIRKML